MNKNIKIIISGGGTGGHIYPALAIANELKHRLPMVDILFVGAKGRMEMQRIPAAGYPIEGLWISGLQRKLNFENLLFPFKVISSLFKSRQIISKFVPDVVIGTGGYASGAVVKVAAQMGIPTLVQEQNSYPGITNRLLAKKAKCICVAYEGLDRYFQGNKIAITGNPVRQDLVDVTGDRDEALAYFNVPKGMTTLLVLGGSLGSKRINELIDQQINNLESRNIFVLWQTGSYYYEQYKSMNNESVKVFAFIEHMNLAYSAADIVISRAGAGSISELALVGKPVLFIPSPHVAEDHQTKNAQNVVDKQAALMLKESELGGFEKVLDELINDHPAMSKMAGRFKQLARPNATKDIVDQILALIK